MLLETVDKGLGTKPREAQEQTICSRYMFMVNSFTSRDSVFFTTSLLPHVTMIALALSSEIMFEKRLLDS